jgi:hypothetical protein
MPIRPVFEVALIIWRFQLPDTRQETGGEAQPEIPQPKIPQPKIPQPEPPQPEPPQPRTRVLLSYSRKDADFTRRLAEALTGRGYAPDYGQSARDPASIDTGIAAEDEWWQRLEKPSSRPKRSFPHSPRIETRFTAQASFHSFCVGRDLGNRRRRQDRGNPASGVWSSVTLIRTGLFQSSLDERPDRRRAG